jgi:hypothetical protein
MIKQGKINSYITNDLPCYNKIVGITDNHIFILSVVVDLFKFVNILINI